jgi:predicted aspartyl protease
VEQLPWNGLVNAGDLALVRQHTIDKDEVRRMNVRALVDAGALYMTINENIQEILQLPVIGKKKSQLANGKVIECDIVGPLEVRFKEHISHCRAVVMPDDSEPLLGAIPMEDMCVIIDPQRQELITDPRPSMLVGLRPIS